MTIKKLYFDLFLDMLNSEVLSYSIARTPSVAVMFDIWGCVVFDSLFFVKTVEKHPRFYIKIFRFLNIKKARKIGAAIRNVNNRLRKKKLSAIGLVMLIE